MTIFCKDILILCLVLGFTLAQYDVVVVGGGEAGVAAAVQASLLGASTILLEESDYIGGMMTAAGVSSMDGNYEGFHRTGIYKNFTDRIINYYTSIKRSTGVCYWSNKVICFEPTIGERILREMLKEANVKVIEQVTVTNAFYKGNAIERIELSNGLNIVGKVFIDATEYGDLMHVANVKYRAGNETTPNLRPEGCVQPFTYTAVIKQYDYLPEALKFKLAPPGFNYSEWSGTVQRYGSIIIQKYPWSWEFFKIYRGMPDSSRPGRNDLTKTGINVGPNDYKMNVRELTPPERERVLCEAKMKTIEFMYYIQRYIDPRWSVAMDEKYDTPYNLKKRCPNIPAEYRIFEVYMPVIPYIRESRRLYGLYTLTLNDTYRDKTRDAKTFEDSVAIGDYEEDLHGCLDYEVEFNERDPWPSKIRKAFEIPLRCFIPEKVDGLLAAGKTISVSRLTNGASRNQPVSMLTGQAAGVAAALAAKNGVQPREVNYKDVQKILDQYGVIYKANPKNN